VELPVSAPATDPSGEGLSLRATLRRIVMVTSAVALLLACAAFVAYDFFSARSAVTRQLSALAGIVGSQSTAALAFDDPKAAHEILTALAAERQVMGAALYRPDGRCYAAWTRPGTLSLPKGSGPDGTHFEGGEFHVTLPVVQTNSRIGTIHLWSDLEELSLRLRTNTVIVVVVLLASSLVAFVLAARLEGRITHPILKLLMTVKQVTERKDYAVRADRQGGVEFSALAQGFNEMLSQIQSRDAELQKARNELEARVHERTRELQKKEEQLLQSQKMEAVGRLSGGLAHDFNNLLSAVLGFAELALTQPNLDPRTREFLEEIQKAGQQSAALTNQLLAISRQQLLQPVLLDLNALVEDLKHAVARLVGDGIRLDVKLDPGLPHVKADPAPLRQVLLHLVTNAREAMPQGGQMTVETSEETLAQPLTWRNETVPAGRYARLSVADTGSGISPEVQTHLFEPFFNGRGRTLDRTTGLGLSTVYGIVKQSGGHVVVESKQGQGATFSVYLPAEGDAAVRRSTTVHLPVARKQGTTVLLVEDEAMVRKLAGEVLRRSGFQVEEATQGREALDRFAEQPDRYDLVLTDVVMPIMGGRELAEEISKLSPGTKILFMSGYTDDIELHDEARKRRIPLIPKPFSAAALAAKVKEMLGAGQKEPKPS
jgi:signal transduction histidine kinase/CheY-like chemotaxis protein